ncbi:MAG: phosphotransferase [Planctomycetes bacterium]|nr:phosphotransferase [Planctomycetota bacterium]
MRQPSHPPPHDPTVERELKRDLLGSVHLVRISGADIVHAVRRTPSKVPGFGAVARLLIRREQRALRALAGIAGVPAVLEVEGGGRQAFRSWLPGAPLSAVDTLRTDFFDRLEELVERLHDRSVCHNDLHKEANILVGDDGLPCLVDFQLASVHPRRGREFALRIAEDIRHVRKHRSVYVRGMGGAPAPPRDVPKPRRLSRAWRRFVKPVYNLVTRHTFVRRFAASGEPPRRRDGGWPRWTTVGPVESGHD